MSTWLLYLRIKLAKPYLSLLSSEIPVLKEMTDKTEFSCGLTFIKQELIIPDEVSTIVTKEDEKPNIDSAGGLVHAKEEKDDLDEGGLIHVRQEIIYLPDESSSNWNVSIKKEMTFDTESNAGGITEVKQEVYVKHEELLISDEDSNHAPSIPHSNDSRADLDFVVDEQDLESYHMSSDDDVPSKINQEEQKNKESDLEETREKVLQKKREQAKLRRNRIKNDPVLWRIEQGKQQVQYARKKEKKQVKPVAAMTAHEHRLKKTVWRKYSKRHYNKKKSNVEDTTVSTNADSTCS
ncbi:uncharacterized protein [Halyomorpha halys]|uniref:uncharacterized protein isoform X2 n=1 Tax=Halyomorpha halys TaxID=286706 RepID=UPI000D0C7F02|nr:uncharacterized protein LOC106691818 isoform X6 [Halyomorpha halys]